MGGKYTLPICLVHEATLVPSITLHVQGVTASFSGTGEAQELPAQVGGLLSMHPLHSVLVSDAKNCTTHHHCCEVPLQI